MLVFIGVQLVTFGLLAEVMARTYYESQDKRPYLISEELNRPPEKQLPRAVGQ